jgi:hypothetical protein
MPSVRHLVRDAGDGRLGAGADGAQRDPAVRTTWGYVADAEAIYSLRGHPQVNTLIAGAVNRANSASSENASSHRSQRAASLWTGPVRTMCPIPPPAGGASAGGEALERPPAVQRTRSAREQPALTSSSALAAARPSGRATPAHQRDDVLGRLQARSSTSSMTGRPAAARRSSRAGRRRSARHQGLHRRAARRHGSHLAEVQAVASLEPAQAVRPVGHSGGPPKVERGASGTRSESRPRPCSAANAVGHGEAVLVLGLRGVEHLTPAAAQRAPADGVHLRPAPAAGRRRRGERQRRPR